MDPVRAFTETAQHLASAKNRDELFFQLTRCSCYETDSFFSALYLNNHDHLILEHQSHFLTLPDELSNEVGMVDFILDCPDYLIYHGVISSFMSSLLLLPSMKSAAAFPLFDGTNNLGILILNSENQDFYGFQKIEYLNAVSRVSVSSLSRIYSSLS